MLLTWSVEPQELAAGAVVSIFAALFSSRFFIHEDAGWFFRPARLFALLYYIFVVFMKELIKANIDMAKRCFTGCKNVNPGVVRVPVKLKSQYAQAMLANSITLTPGTVTLDIGEEKGKTYYYVQWIDVAETNPDKAGEMIKGSMERQLGKVWEK